ELAMNNKRAGGPGSAGRPGRAGRAGRPGRAGRVGKGNGPSRPGSRGRATHSAGRSRRHVYFFGNGKSDGDRTMKDLLGGKGSGLAEMTNAGLPVPPGFTISTDVCTIFYKEKSHLPAAVEREIEENLRKLERAAGG